MKKSLNLLWISDTAIFTYIQRFKICGYTLDKCKAIYFNSDIILVRHIFLHYFLKASCLANDRWLLGVLFFCLLSTTLLEPITLLRRTTPYLVFLIDLKWVVYVGITQDQWLLLHFYCHFLMKNRFIRLKAIWIKLTKF